MLRFNLRGLFFVMLIAAVWLAVYRLPNAVGFYLFALVNWLWAAGLFLARERTTGQARVFLQGALPLAALAAASTGFVLFVAVAHLLHLVLEPQIGWYQSLVRFHTLASEKGIYVWGKPLYAWTLVVSSLGGVIALILKSVGWGKEYSPEYHNTPRITYDPLGSPLDSRPDRIHVVNKRTRRK